MQTAKEKLSDMASAAKEHLTICRAKVEEKAEKAAARTGEEKVMATERRKAKEAEAKKQLYAEKAKHAKDKLRVKYTHAHHLGFGTPHEQPSMVTGHQHLQPPVTTIGGYDTTYVNQPEGMATPMAGTTVPAYPLGGNPAPTGRIYPSIGVCPYLGADDVIIMRV